MAGTIEVHYLRADARFAKARGVLGNKVVTVPGAEQAHSVSRDRLFIPNVPVDVFHVQDLLDRALTPVPHESVRTGRRVVVCEDHQIVPLLPDGGEADLAPSEFNALKVVSAAEARAGTQQEGESYENRRMWFNLLMAGAFVLFGIIALILVMGNFA